MATVTEIISRIDTMIYNLLADSASVTSYSFGGKSVSKTEAFNALQRMRDQYDKIDKETPYEDIRHIAHDYDEWGQDISEYIGDTLE